ncbi:MAG: DegV family protein [Acidimicrobiales bacterium]
MTGVRVVTDSACDLPDRLLADLGVGMVPLSVRFGSEELIDRTELSIAEFWRRCASSSTLPQTAAPSPGAFQEAFEKMRAEGATAVVCVNLSAKLSATIEAARQAARDLAGAMPIAVVDSANVTLGQGLVVTAAAEAAAAGGAAEEVVAAAEEAARTTRTFAALDTLENLKKGGRIGGLQAFIGSLLVIKPVIEIRDGVVEAESKQRTRARSLRYLAGKVAEAGPTVRLAAFSAQAADFDQFLGMLREAGVNESPVLGEIGPVIGTHSGPGAIGVSWQPT